MNNVMIDLETMSTKSDAAIVAIGAVKFDANGIKDKINIVVDLKSSVDQFGHLDANTILWWMKQAPAARDILTNTEGLHIIDALNMLSSFIGKDDRVWGNGATFDNVVLKSAYDNCSIPVPWKYYNNMCYRTLKNLVPDVKLIRSGIHHSALDDAMSQANHLVAIMEQLGLDL